ncbi:hypothetical protein [Dyadobacter sp. CY356]|uniref:hypothetical protein n=1 Tax=Dyadobacter sp. CY356 TaxID=2906442 RepID=UPI001F306F7B|nr:hypothetical protein [Dyadobacter sp. CY356]MCF0057486.1 hypothetical protein [Dyadobacter sp. CY356]
MKSNQEIFYDLLKVVHTYYPVGFPYSNLGYDGYKKLQSIIVENCQSTMDGSITDPWNSVCKSLEELNLNRTYFDASAIAALPSQRFMAIFHESHEGLLHRRTLLTGVVSLLSNYYCVWIEEQLATFSENGMLNEVVDMHRKQYTIEEKGEIDAVHNIMKTNYPDYIHVEYNLLQKKIYGALPVGCDPQSMIYNFPIFDFIFGQYKPSGLVE